MATVLTNAILVQLDPPSVHCGGLRIDGATIEAVGANLRPAIGDNVVDCRGAVVLPGLVNGHTHLYAALATGMPPPPRGPANFHEILQFIWWRLDRALDPASVRLSATIGALDALRCGTTTLIDHHASPNCIADSLSEVDRGLATAGVRGVLCYEVSERNGREGVVAGLAENERYGVHVAARRDGHFAAMVGAHAAFTLTDDDLAACASLARRLKVGVHIHVAEDPCDDEICRGRYGGGTAVERLAAAGVLKIDSILGHGTHLSAADLRAVNSSKVCIAHNPRSNMHNSVGYARIDEMRGPVLLGTDGIGADMFAEARAAWFKARDARIGVNPQRILAMLGENARQAGRRLGVKLGVLEAGAAADVVVTDYVPATVMSAENLVGHVIFSMGSRHVRSVFVGGRARLVDRMVAGVDEARIRNEAREAATKMWERMGAIPI